MSGPGQTQTKEVERTVRPRSTQPFWAESGPAHIFYNIIIDPNQRSREDC
jgi:hypothetical protein